MQKTTIVDRRPNGRNKSTVNRERLKKRLSKSLQEAVQDVARKGTWKNIVSRDKKGIIIRGRQDALHEPTFRHGKGGKRGGVHPGNKKFIAGDVIPRPQGGGAGDGAGTGAGSGQGDDDFYFELSANEFLEYLFEDWKLPNMVKKELFREGVYERRYAGIASEGNPSKIHIPRSWIKFLGRRRAVGATRRNKARSEREALEKLLVLLRRRGTGPTDAEREEIQKISKEIARAEDRSRKVTFDPHDLRYRLHTQVPVPAPRAVMFCVMDVSGSMSEEMKDIAKRSFILLYLFLRRNYEWCDVVFIRYTHYAKEVDSEEFFSSRESGGTVVSNAFDLVGNIYRDRYGERWNTYVMMASDGDDEVSDVPRALQILEHTILPVVQYFSYLEVGEKGHKYKSDLWDDFLKIRQTYGDRFNMIRTKDAEEVYPLFEQLFKKVAR